MIDFHCHIDLYPDPASVIERANREGIYVLAVTTTPKAWSGTQNLLKGCSRIKTAVGIHPELVGERHQEIDLLCSIMQETRYVGEIGIDGSPQHRSTFDLQQQIFRRVLSKSVELGGRILSIHSRYAANEVLSIIEEYPKAGIFVLHWFSGSIIELDRAIKSGCWFSVGPAMLASQRGRELFLNMPRDKVVTETDGPFAMIDKKSLMPWDVGIAFSSIAKLWNIEIDLVKKIILGNFQNLIKKQ